MFDVDHTTLCVRPTPVAEGSGYRRPVSATQPQCTLRMERSTNTRWVTLPDSSWTVPARAVTCGACSFSTALCRSPRRVAAGLA